jgi:hypothetical protein
MLGGNERFFNEWTIHKLCSNITNIYRRIFSIVAHIHYFSCSNNVAQTMLYHSIFITSYSMCISASLTSDGNSFLFDPSFSKFISEIHKRISNKFYHEGWWAHNTCWRTYFIPYGSNITPILHNTQNYLHLKKEVYIAQKSFRAPE